MPIRNTEAGAVLAWDDLKKRAGAVGITPQVERGKFQIRDIPSAHGEVICECLDELELFIRGYELGYKSSL